MAETIQTNRNILIKQVMENITHWDHYDLVSHTQAYINQHMTKLSDNDLIDYCAGFGISIETGE